jgi:hypothetical protein
MSAVALPFDHTMALGPRPAFTWPAGPLDSSHSHSQPHHHHHQEQHILGGADFSTLAHGSDASLTPPSVPSSITSSPPRHSYAIDQRDNKRQQDRSRRDCRLASRLRRVSSQPPYMDAHHMPIHEVTSGMDMPAAYSTAAAPMSLLTEPAAPMSSHSYMPSYSPPLQDPNQAQMFPTPYSQSIPQTYALPMEYNHSSYGSPGAYSNRSSPLPVNHQDAGLMYQVPAVMATGGNGPNGASGEGGHVRVVQSRPKPRCWEHGCNGRQFSTFSNLLRHQREKSGQAAKASCPNCGAEFTRTTARNGHLLHDKCKQRRNS